jgi:predicted phosphodiesterase
MRSLGWAPIQYNYSVLIREGKCGHRHRKKMVMRKGYWRLNPGSHMIEKCELCYYYQGATRVTRSWKRKEKIIPQRPGEEQ